MRCSTPSSSTAVYVLCVRWAVSSRLHARDRSGVGTTEQPLNLLHVGARAVFNDGDLDGDDLEAFQAELLRVCLGAVRLVESPGVFKVRSRLGVVFHVLAVFELDRVLDEGSRHLCCSRVT